MGNIDHLIGRLTLLLASAWVLWLTWPPEWFRGARLPRTQVAYRTMPGKGPWVIALPGYWLPQEFMDDPAYEFHRRGFSVAILDLNRTNDPTAAVAELLEMLPNASVYAHSGSVTPTVEAAARTGKARALVLLGFDPTGRRTRPPLQHVLLGFGRFDDYLSEEEMRQALAATGTGKLVVSPASAHGGEPFDPNFLQQGAEWLADGPLQPSGLPYTARHLAWMVVGGVSGPLLPVWACTLLGLAVPWAGAAALLARGGKLVGAHLTAAASAGLVATWLQHPGDPDWALTIALSCLLYLPSEGAGVLAQRLPQHLGPLLLACWLPSTRLCQGWLERWTRACGTRPAGFVAVGVALAASLQSSEILRSAGWALPLYLLFLRRTPSAAPARPPEGRRATP